VLDGGSGNDSLDGGDGRDWATYFSSAAGVTVDLNITIAQDTIGAGVDTLTSIENLAGSEFADTLTGDAGNNRFYGYAGDDLIIGGLGNDRLDGAAGADDMRGGGGNDVYFIDDAGDLVTELDGEGMDSVRSSISYAMTDHVEILTLTGVAAIDGTGNAQDNAIIANRATNRLDGGAGDDRLYGMGGDDVLVGGLGNDRLDGGGGIDDMAGGAGNDVYVVYNAGDV
jgi:serralysin